MVSFVNTIKVSSPAKLNLYLRVTGRLSNGYHLLHTLFHRISLKDDLSLTKTKKGFSLKCNKPHIPTGEDNIITRAYRLLQEKFPELGGVRVVLTKRVPDKAGLGGGSSNAAAFLLAMKKLYRLPLTRRQLLAMGRKLGADVPFFLYDVNQAVASGRGDQIKPRPCKARLAFLLITANKGLSTKQVFESCAKNSHCDFLTKKGATVRLLCTFLDQKKHSKLADNLHNDLEKSAFLLRPSIRKQIQILRNQGFECVRMSGSGPTVFTILPNDKKAEEYLAQVQALLPSANVAIAYTY